MCGPRTFEADGSEKIGWYSSRAGAVLQEQTERCIVANARRLPQWRRIGGRKRHRARSVLQQQFDSLGRAGRTSGNEQWRAADVRDRVGVGTRFEQSFGGRHLPV